MNLPSFTGSSTTEDPENFIEELQKEGRVAILICDIDISRLMVYVQQVEKEKLRDRDEFKNKRAKTGNNTCREGFTGFFKCEHNGHFMRKCPKNKQGNGNRGNRAHFSSVAPPDRVALRGATSGTGGGSSCLYAIISRQEQEDSPDFVTGMIQVFNSNVYALLDP
ncbi:hypothetical protein R3W88_015060 [Solanum pinnatisectum]|uniref:CCHC-type domain-containing protein n=1 Tax=Solanum pinnatisectum TaxID=50273 RepID=A0AAV9KTF0_9SOLN|nr:hypothetical protein R3W88_015060 [Solanum pinnatisectum]